MASGHQLLFEFDTFYIRVLLALHCQIVPCTRDIFQKVRSSTYTIGNILVVWQLAIELVEDLPLCFLFTDYNRLVSIIVVTKGPRCQKWDPERNCDPMEDWETYERQIRNRRSQYLQKKISIVDAISTDTLFKSLHLRKGVLGVRYLYPQGVLVDPRKCHLYIWRRGGRERYNGSNSSSQKCEQGEVDKER